jgi:uncharacterized protein involved in outer membrane biogenesis
VLRLIKWLFILLFVAVALIVGLLLSKDAIAKAAVVQQIRAQTGMDVKIGRFSIGLLSPVVTIENFKLYNTPEFGGTPFLDIPELHIEFDRDALTQRKLHITLLRLNLAELTVVRNDSGRTNITSQARLRAPLSPGAKAVEHIEFTGVEVANLSLGRAQFIDLRNPRNNREFNANLQNQVFRNVKTTGDLYGVLIMLWLRGGGG